MKLARLPFNLVLTLILLVLVYVGLTLGIEAFSVIETPDGNQLDLKHLVIFEVRLPRLCLAMLCGACLAITGNAMQGIFQNPLASPGLLGSASGASTASVLLLYYAQTSTFVLLSGGVLGASVAFFVVYLIAYQRGPAMLILAGVAVNALLAATTTLLLSNAKNPWALAELYHWLQGSLTLANFDDMRLSMPFVIAGLWLIFSQRRYIDALTFGEETAKTMGIRSRHALLLNAFGVSLILGAVIPQTGVIGFIGLVAPHLARMLLKTRPSQLYLTSALLGAILLLIADLLVWHVPLFDGVFVGTLTSIIGAPFLVWILYQYQTKRHT